jgi:hypothetical protein
MFGKQIDLAPQQPDYPIQSFQDSPYSDSYRINPALMKPLLEPFQWLALTNFLLIGLGIFLSLFTEMESVITVITTMVAVGGLFYLLGVFSIFLVYQRDRNLIFELDHQNGLMHYKNARENLLFHRDQVLICEWHQNLLFPYRVDQLTLHLKGERSITISNLVIDPTLLLTWVEATYVHRQHWVKTTA